MTDLMPLGNSARHGSSLGKRVMCTGGNNQHNLLVEIWHQPIIPFNIDMKRFIVASSLIRGSTFIPTQPTFYWIPLVKIPGLCHADFLSL